jgi:transposase
MTEVIIGIDPHKGSHTAVVLDRDEQTLARLRVTASGTQLDQLRGWAARWPERTWAIEGARGLGRLLAQQLVATGEHVVDVQPKLAARVRLLNSGQVNKNDPNDARSVAVAALRAPSTPSITVEDDTAAMKMWARRYRDLGSLWTQSVCRLHAVLCDLVPGGFARRISVPQAIGLLATIDPHTPADAARLELAQDLVADLQRSTASAVRSNDAWPGSSPPPVRPSPRCTVSGRSWPPPCSASSATSTASPAATTSPPTTARHRSKCPLAIVECTGYPDEGTGNSTTPSTWPQ